MQVNPETERLRVGRKVGRTIYVHKKGDPESGVLIGTMDTPELSKLVLMATNRYLDSLEE